MFVAVRRGPASIAKCLQFSPSFSTSSNLALSCRNPHLITRLLSNPAIRAFNTASAWRQEAAAQIPKYGQYGDAGENESSQKPPQNNARDELVTRFAELGERKMVCKTIVDTVTRTMGLETMTHVQTLTINETLKGIDVYA